MLLPIRYYIKRPNGDRVSTFTIPYIYTHTSHISYHTSTATTTMSGRGCCLCTGYYVNTYYVGVCVLRSYQWSSRSRHWKSDGIWLASIINARQPRLDRFFLPSSVHTAALSRLSFVLFFLAFIPSIDFDIFFLDDLASRTRQPLVAKRLGYSSSSNFCT